MRSRALALTATIALAAPTALAFRRGGDFSSAPPDAHPVAPHIAAIAAWLLVIVVALVARVPLPRAWAGRAALGGMTLLAAWTGASISWAPIAGAAGRDFELALFYLAVLTVAIAVLRGPALRRRIEPALAAGSIVVMGYALLVRLLPGVIPSLRTGRADNRLDQPLTYWNAEGALAGMGLVLCARIAGDTTRSALARALSAAACVPLTVGLYLTYSRGALAMTGAALLVLLMAAPTRPQVRAVALVVLAGAIAVFAVTRFSAVASLLGSRHVIERDGAVFLAILVALAVATGAGAIALGRWERRAATRVRSLSVPRWAPLATGAAVAIVLGVVVYAGLQERGLRGRPQTVAAAGRLANVDSNRYAYWGVALHAFRAQPLRGVGASGFAIQWLKERPSGETPRRAHSLELETAGNLGLVGLLALVLVLGGAVVAGVQAHRRRPELVAGWCAAATVWLLHSAIDWDWEMPAVTLVAVLLAGALIGVADEPASAGAAVAAGAAEPVPHAVSPRSPSPART